MITVHCVDTSLIITTLVHGSHSNKTISGHISVYDEQLLLQMKL